ncbi:MAG: histone deacetylase [Syntrophorhabdaceae bacterium]|nr:histone deacetylase [Syntrophorhabdaceae bacterium]
MDIYIVKDKIYLEHGADPYHPENPNRLKRIYGMLEELDGEGITYIKPRMATHEEIGLNHDMDYIDEIASTKGKERRLDPDTATSPKSYEAACMAVGGVLELVDRIMEEKTHVGFALVRPPGHHAEHNRAMGFCIFNNVAVAARYLQKKYGLNRMLVVDFDLHHGNGTQHSFYRDPEILYFSTHQYPYYPGTGHYTEIGEGRGKGYTVNVPLSYGMGDADFIYIFEELLVPISDRYKPEFVLVSAGFDTHINDPLGSMRVTEGGFAAMTRILLSIAKTHCKEKTLFALEGGYNLDGLTNSVKAVILEMTGESIYPFKKEQSPSSQVKEIVKTVKGTLKDYWTGL